MNIDPPQDQFNKVINLYNSGQMLHAIGSCKKLLKTYKNSLNLLNILGGALCATGKFEKAINVYKNAIAIDSKNSEFYYNLGFAFQSLNRLNMAIDNYNKATNLNPSYIDAYNNLGTIYEINNPEKAIENYSKVIEIDSNYVSAYSNRGNVYCALLEQEKAVEDYTKAIQIKPDHAEVYNSLGVTLQAIGRVNEALENYNKATQLNPDYSEAYNNLGSLFEAMGKVDKAIENYNKAIKLDPDSATAHCNLSKLKKYTTNDSQIETMRTLLDKSKSNDHSSARLCFSLAKVYEDLGEYDKSFNYVDRGNKHRKKELDYDINHDKDMINKIKEIFYKDNIDTNPLQVQPTEILPVFIVGMPRSGTSLIEQILSNHNKVYGAGELEIMGKLVRSVMGELKNEHRLSKNNIQSIHNGYLEALTALNVSEKIITDKMPINFMRIGFILSAFPKAKIIHLTRDRMAVCWSIYKHNFSSKGYGFGCDMEDLSEFYELYLDLMSFWEDRFPNNIYNLCYEDLVEDQETEITKLLKFCDLDWEKQCLNPHKNQRAVRTASNIQVRKKIYKGSSEVWKKYQKHLSPLMQNLK